MDSHFKLYAFCTLTLLLLGWGAQGARLLKRTPLEAFFGVATLVLISEFVGIPGIAIGQVAFTLLILMGIFQSVSRGWKLETVSWKAFRSEAFLFSLSLIFWAWLLRDLACLPSVDDGGNHLFFYTRIRENFQALTGHIPFIRDATRHLGYYPSGFHALSTVMARPASLLLSVNPLTELQGLSLIWLALFPLLLFQGAKRVLSPASEWPLLLAAVFASFIEVFPLSPMGEGGISRVAGLVLAIPVMWRIIESRLSLAECAALGSGVVAVLFWIHPSCTILVGATFAVRLGLALFAGGVERAQALKGAGAGILGGIAGGALVFALLRSGSSDLQGSGVLQKWVQVMPLTWATWLDRVIGPIHYFLDDSAGYGKFFSPRSLLAELGMGILLFRPGLVRSVDLKRLRPYLWMGILLPFVLSWTIFTSFPPALYIGLFFYHFVKRMAELFFWPLFLGWVAGFLFLWERRSKPLIAVTGVIALTVLATSWVKLGRSLGEFNRLFRAPTRAGLTTAFERFQKEDSPDVIWICPTNDFQPWLSFSEPAARHGLRERIYFERGTECISSLVHRDYCRQEIEKILSKNHGKSLRFVPLLDSTRGCKKVGT